MRKVPVLSLKNYTHGTPEQKQKFIEDLYSAFKDYGFLVLDNHAIDPRLLNKAYDLSKRFFDLPYESKEHYKVPNAFGQIGFTAYKSETAKNWTVADLKEFWHVGRELPDSELEKLGYMKNVWPTELPEFKEVFLKIYSELEKTGNILLEALTYSLGVEPDFFRKSHNNGASVLRLLHYPKIPNEVEPGSVRAFKHSDIKNGEWLPIESDKTKIVVNVGDMLQRISDLSSTVHQVCNPKEEELKNKSRYSMPFFLHARGDWKLEKLAKFKGQGEDLPIITANEYLHERLKELGLKK
jgi:isopenicillin N synthase-like dioxygenase